jgi:hypothetical protein
MVICLSAVFAFGTYGLVRLTKTARENARRARLAALDERMRRGYRINFRDPGKPPSSRPKSPKKRM